MAKRRPYRRAAGQYPCPISTVVSEKTKKEIEVEADRLEVSINEIVRRCIEMGLPLLRRTGPDAA